MMRFVLLSTSYRIFSIGYQFSGATLPEQFGILCRGGPDIGLPENPVNGCQQIGPGGQQGLSVSRRNAANGDDGQIKLPACPAEYRGLGRWSLRFAV